MTDRQMIMSGIVAIDRQQLDVTLMANKYGIADRQPRLF